MRRTGRLWPVHLVLGVGAAAMVAPFFWQILTSLKTYSESVKVPPTLVPSFDWSNFQRVFETGPFLQQYANTVLMTAGRTLAQLLFCSLAAYAFARLRFPGRDAIFVVLLSVLMVPGQLFLIPQYQIVQSLGWLNSMPGLIAPGMFSAFGTFMLRQFFLNLPTDVEEAAKIDGANPLRIFWSVMLPLARPGLISLGVLTVLWSWNDLMWPLVINTDPEKMPLSAGLAALQGEHMTDYPVLMAGSLMASAPIIVLFVVLQKRLIQGIAFTGSK
ncbi:sugar ABC transporter permease [Streptomyces sp. Ru71]|uniref:carbohydrate ABC transporter permease n=1 Tax=Streptomyces sp. Ru71 TaxID=2080746 RepID=UPI000CDE0CAC|nr:carbohydrate ABC transporter permease [Streptomyces sp. Ru71]POX55131.1 sugar ABC transporter permease [Streptomyces sp. Ru71]